jgi:N-acetylated-alpha-linked acidic dipeptidase
VAGRSFRVNGSQALSDVILEALADVPDPSHAGSVFAVTRAHALAEGRADWARLNRERRWRGEPERPFTISLPSLGSGSDYTAFLDHLGVASADLRFEGLQGSYHSMYDNFEYLNRVIDPGYPYHVAMTDLWTRIALRIAEAEVLPFHYSASATFVLDELEAIDERVQDLNDQQPDSLLLKSDLGSVRQAAARMLASAGAAEKSLSGALAAGTLTREREVAADQALISVERQFLGNGLPDRTWFRNEIYAPGLNTGYAPVPLPRLGQAVLDKDRAAYAAAARPIQDALDRAAAVLAKLGAP